MATPNTSYRFYVIPDLCICKLSKSLYVLFSHASKVNKSAPHGSFLAPKLSSSTSSSSGAASASKVSSDVTTSASTSASTSTSALTSGSASTSALASMSASMSAFVLKKVPASTATLRVRPFDASRRFPTEVTPCPCPRTHFFKWSSSLGETMHERSKNARMSMQTSSSQFVYLSTVAVEAVAMAPRAEE